MMTTWTSTALLAAALALPALAQQERPVLMYSETPTNTRASTREWTGTSWTSATTTNPLSADVAWQEVVNSPATTERALMMLCEDRTLSMALWNGTFWGLPTTVAADAGSITGKVFACAYENTSGELMGVYRKTTGTSIYYRTYTTAIPAEQTLNLGLATAPTWMELVSRPRSNELVLLVRAGASLYATVWDGSAWGNTVTLETALPTLGRPFSVAYMSQTGNAMAAWCATTGAPKYRVWDGTNGAWGAASTLPAISGGVVAGWLTLTSNPLPASNELLATVIGSNMDVNLNNWTGSAWGTNLIAETNAAAYTERRADIGYQWDGTRAIAAWHRNGATVLRMRTWNGTSWSAETAGPDMGSNTQCVRLVPGFDSDEVLLATRRRGAATYADYLAFSQGGTVNLTGTVIGSISSGGGLTLPAPPVAAAGAVDINVPNGATQNITPGNYRDLITGNTVTLNFNGPGDYVFRLFKANFNATTFNLNTNGGRIRLIFTTSGFDGKNDTVFNNVGSGEVEIHVVGGNFVANNNTVASNISLLVYNGSMTFGNNTNFAGLMYASGNITGTGGTIQLPSSGAVGGPGIVSTCVFVNGAAGAPVDQGVSAVGLSYGVVSLAGPPPKIMRVSRWREIGPDE